MDLGKINNSDMDQFITEYPQAYHFLLGRTHRNEWFKYANKIYGGEILNEYETKRFKELTQLHQYDLSDIPTLEKINAIAPGLVDMYLVKTY